MNNTTVEQRITSKGPKRILSLDGGGIRGVLTLEYLSWLEEVLRKRHGGDPEYRLCDYFDLIGGTSTGAIIAVELALGHEVKRVQKLYHTLAKDVFKGNLIAIPGLAPKFPRGSLSELLKNEFGDITLGSPKIKTGLAIMTKRLDTNSAWIIHNNPLGKFYDPGGNACIPNKDYLLRQVVRASAAAPFYFEPERIKIAEGLEGAFVDGGVSTFNNPALQLFMMATLRGYGYNWPMGEDNLLLISVGTGSEKTMATEAIFKMMALQVMGHSLVSLINDCDTLTQAMLQWFSGSRTAWLIDSEMGDLNDDLVAGLKLLTYIRYNVKFEREWIRDKLGMVLTDAQVNGLCGIDNIKSVRLLEDLGKKTAEKQVKEDHLSAIFDRYRHGR
jgi:hypothetical protein